MLNSTRKVKLIVLIITFGCFIVLSCSDRSEKEKIKLMEKSKLESEIGKKMIEMAKHYNAVIDWEKTLEPEEIFSMPYTLEVQNALIREDKRPILFIASIQDIERSGNEYIISFDRRGSFSGLFILKCSELQVQKILNQPQESLWDNYSIIASISNVKKTRFSLTSSSFGEYSEVLIAKGDCLDLMFIGDYGLSEMQKLLSEVTK